LVIVQCSTSWASRSSRLVEMIRLANQRSRLLQFLPRPSSF
jgi:hypothetical protein